MKLRQRAEALHPGGTDYDVEEVGGDRRAFQNYGRRNLVYWLTLDLEIKPAN